MRDEGATDLVTFEDGATDSAPEGAPGFASGCLFGIEPKLQIFGTVPFGFGNLSLAWLQVISASKLQDCVKLQY